MRLYDISQLAVLEAGKLVGIVDESDLLLAVQHGGANFDRPVREVMSSHIRTIDRRAEIKELLPIFDAGWWRW